ncbi:hypothetical protein Bhyg_08793, partial [Pseudolycoriella hygida]
MIQSPQSRRFNALKCKLIQQVDQNIGRNQHEQPVKNVVLLTISMEVLLISSLVYSMHELGH